MDPNNNLILYYGTNRLYRSTNGGYYWNPISDDLTDPPVGTVFGTLTTIDVAPSNSEYIYVGTDDSQVWVTTDYGVTWKNISGDLPYRWVSRVKVDPQDENTVYVAFSGLKWRDPQPHIFKSTNTGNSWVDISNNLPDAPINALAVDPLDTKVIYVGNDIGTFVSFNGGEEWEVLGEGLPAVSVYDMKIHPTDYYLAVGTHGRSMYKLDLTEITSIKKEKKIPLTFELKQNYPNPFNPFTTIEYSIFSAINQHSVNVKLKVFDILGREVAVLVNEEQIPGQYTVRFNPVDLPTGSYVYQLQVEDYRTTKKLLFLK
jgi:hypothetical protein